MFGPSRESLVCTLARHLIDCHLTTRLFEADFFLEQDISTKINSSLVPVRKILTFVASLKS